MATSSKFKSPKVKVARFACVGGLRSHFETRRQAEIKWHAWERYFFKRDGELIDPGFKFDHRDAYTNYIN